MPSGRLCWAPVFSPEAPSCHGSESDSVQRTGLTFPFLFLTNTTFRFLFWLLRGGDRPIRNKLFVCKQATARVPCLLPLGGE